mmetsp:Transcript_9213/g.33774  ORF Transcript_9213/g.33774 Transcript_9213/m.33774 type:complete len:437 (+) Transcript_9213:57-1367(+)
MGLVHGLRLLLVALLAAPGAALYGASSAVESLSPGNFDSKVAKGEKPYLVEFFAPWCGHCKQLAPEWEKAAKALKGTGVGIAAVDCDQHQSLCSQYGVQGFPTIKIFKPNAKPADYQGARQAKPITDAAIKALSDHTKAVVKDRLAGKSAGGSGKSSSSSRGSGGGEVITLNESNFDSLVTQSQDLWMVEFFAPWCGHCQRLAPEYKNAAQSLAGKAKLGAVDCTAADGQGLCSKFGVQGYPTLKVFGANKRSPEPYEGARTASGIEDHLSAMADQFGEPQPVLELISPEVVSTNCMDKQICVVCFLPHILDTGAAGRNKYIKVLQKLAEKFRGRPWGFTWAEAGKQAALESAMGVGGFGYPVATAINFKKNVFSVSKEAFDVKATAMFLETMAVARGGISEFQGEPKVVATEPWDGKDGELIVEEEFDLDDIMNS